MSAEADAPTRQPVFKWIYPFEIPVVLYGLVGYWVARRGGIAIDWSVAFDFSYDLLLLREVLRYSFVLLLIVYVRKRFHQGGERGEVLSELKGTAFAWLRPWRDWRRWVEFLRVVLAIKLTIAVHTHLKQGIPFINPVLYDDAFWEIDKAVHLGFDPVRLHLKLFSASVVTQVIDAIYVLWYTVKVIFLVYFVFFAPPKRAWHFLTVYLLLWAIGGGFAIAFPSLGPCYTNPELFANLDLSFANQLQERLWVHYQELFMHPGAYKVQVYDGIAAFPSLHVGFAALFTVSMWPHRKIFWAMVVFSLLIQIGSVHLGWHYAVDGYFATLLVVVLWFALRPFFKEKDAEGAPAPTDPPATDPPASEPAAA